MSEKEKLENEQKKILLEDFNEVEDLVEINQMCKEFVEINKKCQALKRAISIVANSAAVDCLLKEFEQKFMDRCFYENKLSENGMDELLIKYNKEYFNV